MDAKKIMSVLAVVLMTATALSVIVSIGEDSTGNEGNATKTLDELVADDWLVVKKKGELYEVKQNDSGNNCDVVFNHNAKIVDDTGNWGSLEVKNNNEIKVESGVTLYADEIKLSGGKIVCDGTIYAGDGGQNFIEFEIGTDSILTVNAGGTISGETQICFSEDMYLSMRRDINSAYTMKTTTNEYFIMEGGNNEIYNFTVNNDDEPKVLILDCKIDTFSSQGLAAGSKVYLRNDGFYRINFISDAFKDIFRPIDNGKITIYSGTTYDGCEIDQNGTTRDGVVLHVNGENTDFKSEYALVTAGEKSNIKELFGISAKDGYRVDKYVYTTVNDMITRDILDPENFVANHGSEITVITEKDSNPFDYTWVFIVVSFVLLVLAIAPFVNWYSVRSKKINEERSKL